MWQIVTRIPRGTVASQMRMFPMGMGIHEAWEVREMCDWFGLDPKRIHHELWGRIDEVIHSELENRSPDKRTLVGPVNEFCTYIALWAESQYAVEDAAEATRWVVANPDPKCNNEMKANALWFARCLDRVHWRLKIAAEVFRDPALRSDPSLMSLAVIVALRDFTGVKIVDQPVANVREDNVASLTRKERDEIFNNLYTIAQEMLAENNFQRLGSFGWLRHENREQVGYSLDDLARLMALLVARKAILYERDAHGGNADFDAKPGAPWGINLYSSDLPTSYDPRIINTLGRENSETRVSELAGANCDNSPEANELRDKLADLLPHLAPYTRTFFLRYIIQDGSASPKQRRLLIDQFANHARYAWLYSKNITLTPEENLRLEAFLAEASQSRNRTFIYLQLLRQEPEALGESIIRLLNSSNSKQFEAGLEMFGFLKNRSSESDYAEVFQQCREQAESGPNAAIFKEYFTGTLPQKETLERVIDLTRAKPAALGIIDAPLFGRTLTLSPTTGGEFLLGGQFTVNGKYPPTFPSTRIAYKEVIVTGPGLRQVLPGKEDELKTPLYVFGTVTGLRPYAVYTVEIKELRLFHAKSGVWYDSIFNERIRAEPIRIEESFQALVAKYGKWLGQANDRNGEDCLHYLRDTLQLSLSPVTLATFSDTVAANYRQQFSQGEPKRLESMDNDLKIYELARDTVGELFYDNMLKPDERIYLFHYRPDDDLTTNCLLLQAEVDRARGLSKEQREAIGKYLRASGILAGLGLLDATRITRTPLEAMTSGMPSTLPDLPIPAPAAPCSSTATIPEASLELEAADLAFGLDNLSPGEKEMWAKVDALSGRQQEIATLFLFCSRMADDFEALQKYQPKLLAAFPWINGMTLADTFSDQIDAYAVIACLLGLTNAKLAADIWREAADYPYGIVPYHEIKRARGGPFPPDITAAPATLRSKIFNRPYLFKNIVVLLNFIAGVADGFDYDSYLTDRERMVKEVKLVKNGEYGDKRDEWREIVKIKEGTKKYKGMAYFVPPLLGHLIRANHGYVMWERLQSILLGEASWGDIDRILVSGFIHGTIRLSDPMNSTLDQIPPWLMLYPDGRITESQANKVMEVGGNGSRASFALLLKLIRSTLCLNKEVSEQIFGWWAGIRLDLKLYGLGGRERIYDLALRCLSDQNYRDKYLAGEDALEIYLSLWALGSEELKDAFDAVMNIARNGSRAQVIAALYFTCQTACREFQQPVIDAIRARREFTEDAEVQELLVQCEQDNTLLRLVAYASLAENGKPYLAVEKVRRSAPHGGLERP